MAKRPDQVPPVWDRMVQYLSGAMSRRGFMGKLVLVGFLLTTTGGSLAACNAASPSASTSPSGVAEPGSAAPIASGAQSAPVTIVFNHWDPNQMKTAYAPAVAAFEKLHPNITVTLSQVPYGDYWPKLTTGFAAGTAPDVFVNLNNFVQQFAANNTMLDLAPYIKKDAVDLSVYSPSTISTFSKGTAQYALPWIVDTIGMYYNMDLLTKAGITAYPKDLTWAPDGSGTLVPFLQKLTVDANGVTADKPGFDPNHIVQWGFGLSPDSTQGMADEYMLSNGGGYQETPDGSPTINSAANVATYQFIWDLMYKYHVSPPGATVVAPNGGAESGQFLSGQVALLQAGDWFLDPFFTGAKFKLGVGPLPSGPKGNISTINAGANSIFVGTKHPQEAWEFVKFISSPAGQQIIAGTGAGQSAITSMGNVFVDAWKAKGVDATALWTAVTEGKVVSVPTGKNINAVQTATDNAVNAIYLNTSTVQAALDKAQAEAMAAYNGNN